MSNSLRSHSFGERHILRRYTLIPNQSKEVSIEIEDFNEPRVRNSHPTTVLQISIYFTFLLLGSDYFTDHLTDAFPLLCNIYFACLECNYYGWNFKIGNKIPRYSR